MSHSHRSRADRGSAEADNHHEDDLYDYGQAVPNPDSCDANPYYGHYTYGQQDTEYAHDSGTGSYDVHGALPSAYTSYRAPDATQNYTAQGGYSNITGSGSAGYHNVRGPSPDEVRRRVNEFVDEQYGATLASHPSSANAESAKKHREKKASKELKKFEESFGGKKDKKKKRRDDDSGHGRRGHGSGSTRV